MSNYPLYNTPSAANQTQTIGVGTLDFWDIQNEGYKSLTVDDNTLFLEGVALGGGNILVEEVDGVPSHPVHTIVFPNGTVGIQGTTATITLAGSGDMVLASAQTVSGAKTFLDSTLLLRNAANTFSAQFTNTNTAARTYTLPNATGTVALTSDITGTNSGTNTGDQTITLTGAVTGSGTGTFTTSLGSFTRSQLDAAVSDANVMYIGDAPTAHNQAWSTITSTPTTLSGYGITDAVALTSSTLDQFADVTQTAGQTLSITSSTTLSGGTHSGTNTGDNATNSQYSGLVSNATHTGDVTGSTALTIKTDVALAGNPTTTTQATTDNSTRIATTEFVKATTSRLAPFKIDTTATGAKKLYYPVPFACTITGWEMVADASGSVVIDIWKDTYANYAPVVGDTITGSAKPTITTATKANSTTLTGWTTSLAAGDYLEVNVDSVTTITNVTLTLTVTRT